MHSNGAFALKTTLRAGILRTLAVCDVSLDGHGWAQLPSLVCHGSLSNLPAACDDIA